MFDDNDIANEEVAFVQVRGRRKKSKKAGAAQNQDIVNDVLRSCYCGICCAWFQTLANQSQGSRCHCCPDLQAPERTTPKNCCCILNRTTLRLMQIPYKTADIIITNFQLYRYTFSEEHFSEVAQITSYRILSLIVLDCSS